MLDELIHRDFGLQWFPDEYFQSFKHALSLDDLGSDPWIVHKDGWYYYSRVNNWQEIVINKSKTLEDIGDDNTVVWRHDLQHSDAEVWAPELHFIEDRWYIYVTFGKGPQHRMYVLEAVTDDPQGEYILKGKIADPSDRWAIDGTVLHLNDKMYFVWAGWEGAEYGVENLYIAPMSNPWTISGERVCISRPEYGWEKQTLPGRAIVNEGPTVLQHDGKTFIIFSASYATIEDYCLGQLELIGDDPLRAGAWIKKPEPVFTKTTGCLGPGHASFFKKPDGSDWIVYHTLNPEASDWARHVYAQRFNWNTDGSPRFSRPLAIKPRPL